MSYLGSTKYDEASPFKVWEQALFGHPFASSAESENPLLWNWNHVFVRYCDGAYVSGHRAEPVVLNGTGIQLYYRGQDIFEAVLQDLTSRHHLAEASDVVFSGCSSGGISTFAHLDALAARLPGKARVVGFADSGFYLDLPIFTPLKRFVVAAEGQNATGLLDPKCLAKNPGAEERCLIGAVIATYLTTPLFAWQSRYDTDQQSCEMSKECAGTPSCLEAYGANLTSELHRALLTNPKHGAFLDSCSRHCQAPALPHDDASGLTPTKAFARWYKGGKRSYGQGARYPCPSCCAACGFADLNPIISAVLVLLLVAGVPSLGL